MQFENAAIEAATRQQAMDWSLALTSQGIETIIEHNPGDRRWHLLVSQADEERARETIRLYQLENHRWPWRREIMQPGLLFDWVSIIWALLTAAFFWLSTQTAPSEAGRVDPDALAHGQWWRLFTAVWLHADLGHLAANLTFGVVLLGFVMGYYGTGIGLLAAYLAGAIGNIISWKLSSPPHASLGASGLVMGCLGLLAAHSVLLWRKTPSAGKTALRALAAGIMLFVLVGLTPGTDILAHSGGFVAGLFLGTILTFFPMLARKPGLNLVAGVVFAGLTIVCWWLASKGFRQT